METGEPTSSNARAATAVLVVALGLAAAGCGGGTRTVVQAGPPTTPAAAARTGGQGGTAGTDTVTNTGAASTPTTVLRVARFQSPSGNIGCAIAGGQARCDILQRSWRPPARPASCPVDYGQGVEVDAHSAGRLVCAGDTVRDPASAKLAYGAAAQAEGLTCVSRSTGMACTGGASGHGFELSREGYRLF